MRWGILGAGQISRLGVAPALAASEGAEVVAVAARDPRRAAALVPGARAYSDYHALLDDPDVEVVYCALPNDAHVPMVLAALARGRHVLCEKPLGLDAAEVGAAASAAEAAGRLLVEASWYRWHPRTRRAEALVAAGELGRVVAVEAGFTFEGVPDSDYRMDPAMGGGALYDVGCYALSAVGWALGWPDLGVSGLTVSGLVRRRSSSGVDMCTEATLRTGGGGGGGVRADIRAAFDEPERQWLAVRGERATMRFSAPVFTAWHSDDSWLDIEVHGGGGGRQHFAACDPYRLMVEAVSDRVRGGDAWVVPLSDSLAVARAIDALRAIDAGTV